MKILIVEDEKNIAETVKSGLEKEGFAVDWVADGQAALRRIQLHNADYDVIILDLMLPGLTGDEICRSIRTAGISVPVLVLTARGLEEDKVALLDSGADDYLTKPFSFKELLARVRALTRRPKQALPTLLTAGNLAIDPANKIATKDGANIKLTLTEFRILEYLMRNPNQIVERESLINNVWDFNFDSFSNVVDVYICRLRKKIGDTEKEQKLESVRGIGYRLNI